MHRTTQKYDGVIALSGGLDSTTAIYNDRASGGNPLPVFFMYGSRHMGREYVSAMLVTKALGVDLLEVDLREMMAAVSPPGTDRSALLMGSHTSIPEGHYEAESMRQTVVPGRNLLFVSVLAALAEANGLERVILGVHQGDHHIYPDCRPAFVRAAREAVEESTEHKVSVSAPFLSMDKAEIVKLGLRLNVPYHLTRTCYTSGALACGRCGSCTERLEAFAKNRAEDPVRYAPKELAEIGGEG